MPSSKNDYRGVEKSAMLLITLGPEKAAEIFKYLADEEIEELTMEIANTTSVAPQLKEKILQEFYEICIAQEYITEGGIQYAQQVLQKALGKDRAHDLISKLTMSLQVKPFEFARKAEASQLVNFIQDEHPQTIALVLSYLGAHQAGNILSALSKDKQADIIKRIAVMDRTSPEIIREVERVLETKVSATVSQEFASVGGIDSVIEILNSVDRGTEKNILETLEIEDVELAEEIKNKMFVFEDIITLDNKSIQRVLKDVDNSKLAIALKGANSEVKEVMLSNVSKRLAVMINEDMDFMGPVKLRDVEDAQQEIVNVVRKLEEAGEIIIARGGGDEVIV
ncbi:MAG TPA: flagellar motor switch protein FliG [Clostridiales bacterium]|nr:MAG: flagellar motor switch protein FliG [Clostridiales bacterium GWD2_32_19]HCC07610.1 flagellar motor switch protein FliG [Clostridiales bacterium]